MIQANNTTSIDETDGLPMPRRIWAVVSIGFALCMSVLDVNIINIVLPTLSHDFGTSPAVTTWIINGYQLAIVVSLLSFSSLGEIIGYRKVFLSGIGLFCITSLICALSDSFWTLTIARIFQGFSASAITSVNTAQLRYVYPKSQIGRGMGINAMVVAISAAAGPSVASGILSIASWHWLFAINVPLGITALLLGIKHLPRQEERSKRKFDFVSAIANAVTFGLLIYTLDGFAHHEEMDFLVLQLIILAIVGTFYVRRQLTAAAGLIADTDFPAFDSDVYLFVYRSDGGHGVSPVFPSEYVGAQRGHDRIVADSVAVGYAGDGTVGRLSGGTHSSGDIGEYRDGVVCRRTFFTFGAYCRIVRYQYNSSSDALWSRFRVVSDAQ